MVAQDSIYTQLSQTLQKPVDEMLCFLEMKIEVGALAADSFVLDFLAAANGFAERCCSSCAELLRHSSRLPEVRATPTVTLANQIRAEVFPKCDAILEQCRQHLQAGVNAIARVPSQEPGLISTALQGAATGQLAAGLGRHGKTLGTVGAVLAVGEQWSRRTALLATQLEAAEQAQAAARGKIPEYLEAMIPGLCQDLFDYGCAKCLGAEIDFKAQEEALDKFGGFIREHQAKLDRVLKMDADRREADRKRSQEAEVTEYQSQEEASKRKRAEGCGGCLAVVGGLMVFGAGFSLLLSWTDAASTSVSQGATPTSDSQGLAVILMSGVVALIAGVWMLIANRNTKQGALKLEE